MKNKIYEKEYFKDLPDYFWKHWNDKVKKETIKTGFPLFLIRVSICDNKDNKDNKAYKELWDISNDKNDSTFYDEFTFENKIIMIKLNTIFDFCNYSHSDISRMML